MIDSIKRLTREERDVMWEALTELSEKGVLAMRPLARKLAGDVERMMVVAEEREFHRQLRESLEEER